MSDLITKNQLGLTLRFIYRQHRASLYLYWSVNETTSIYIIKSVELLILILDKCSRSSIGSMAKTRDKQKKLLQKNICKLIAIVCKSWKWQNGNTTIQEWRPTHLLFSNSLVAMEMMNSIDHHYAPTFAFRFMLFCHTDIISWADKGFKK